MMIGKHSPYFTLAIESDLGPEIKVKCILVVSRSSPYPIFFVGHTQKYSKLPLIYAYLSAPLLRRAMTGEEHSNLMHPLKTITESLSQMNPKRLARPVLTREEREKRTPGERATKLMENKKSTAT